jgi:hypothetical protein
MTAPRQILPGKTHLVTRRCSERRFFLRPSKETNEIVRYLLAVLSQRYGIALHAFCVMSDQCDRTDVRRGPGAAGSLSWPQGTLADPPVAGVPCGLGRGACACPRGT